MEVLYILFRKLINFLQNGAGNVLNGTFTAAKAVVSGITAFFIGLIFAFYLLAKKETLQRQVNMFMQAALPEKIVNKITYVAKLIVMFLASSAVTLNVTFSSA